MKFLLFCCFHFYATAAAAVFFSFLGLKMKAKHCQLAKNCHFVATFEGRNSSFGALDCQHNSVAPLETTTTSSLLGSPPPKKGIEIEKVHHKDERGGLDGAGLLPAANALTERVQPNQQ